MSEDEGNFFISLPCGIFLGVCAFTALIDFLKEQEVREVKLSAEDVPAIKSYIEDERKDEEKYSSASMTLKDPRSRELAAKLSREERIHRLLWEDLLKLS
jgi:hypothetical protein